MVKIASVFSNSSRDGRGKGSSVTVYIVYIGISAYIPNGTKGHQEIGLDGSVLSIETK